MTFEEFHKSVNRTWRKEHQTLTPEAAEIIHATLGLVGEAGEVADNLKKALFYGSAHISVDSFKLELGDALYYLTKLSELVKSTLAEVMDLNQEKLQKRYPDQFTGDGGIREAA